MLLAEYDYETDIAVQRAEEREIAFAEGIEQGIERGRNEGMAEGYANGSYTAKCQTAKILKQLHCDMSVIIKSTGLSLQEIERL